MVKTSLTTLKSLLFGLALLSTTQLHGMQEEPLANRFVMRESTVTLECLNLLKCLTHLPAVMTLEKPDSYWGKKALYASQAATLSKIALSLFTENNLHFISYTYYLAKYFTLIGYQIDTSELLSKINEKETNKKIVMPTGNKYSQLALLVTESILHSYIIYLKKTSHRFSDGNPSQERVLFALKEVADLVELVRLTLKQKHHSGLVFADEEQQVSTETVPSLEDQVSQESLINSAALDIEHVAVPESVA